MRAVRYSGKSRGVLSSRLVNGSSDLSPKPQALVVRLVPKFELGHEVALDREPRDERAGSASVGPGVPCARQRRPQSKALLPAVADQVVSFARDVDVTPVRDGSGPARLLDMVEGRSKQVLKSWLDAQSATFRDGIEVVAMDGFTGFKTAAAETVPDAVAVMDPFHVGALAGDALDRYRQRAQQATCEHRERTGRRWRIRSTASEACSAPAPSCSATNYGPDRRRCSPTTPTSKSKRPGPSTSRSLPHTGIRPCCREKEAACLPGS